MGKVAGHRGGWGRCSVCLHKDKAAIEEAITAGASLAATAKRFGLTPSSLQRHIVNHPRAGLVRITPARSAPASVGDETSNRLMQLLAAVEALLDNPGSTTSILDCIREARQLVVAHGSWQLEREKVALLRQPAGAVDLMRSEEFIEARTVIVRALAPFPEARRAVVAAIEALQKKERTDA